MPFVAQNPLGPFIPGDQYQIRSEDEGECGTASLDQHLADLAGASGVALASYVQPKTQDSPFAAAPPSVPVADPSSTTFTTSVTVALTAESGAKIHFTTDGSTPTATSTQYSGPLTFTSTTTLKAIAKKGNAVSEIGTFNYTQGTPPEPVTAVPGDGTVFTGSQSVTLSTTTAGSIIYYTTNGTDPTTSSAVYAGAINLTASTQIRAMAWKGGISSGVSIFSYTLQGGTEPPVANPASGAEFETTLNIVLSTPTPGATIYYTVDGSTPTTSSSQYIPPLSLVSTTTIKAFATVDGNDSLVVEFTYTKTGPVCPELTSGNFGWIDYSGGSNSNADLKHEIEHPEDADTTWYYRNCTGAADTNCRDPHDLADAADDHWLVEGTPGHRDSSLSEVCDNWLGQIIYIPIWDDWHFLPGKKANGNNAVFHIIGFAAFRLDGVIDNHKTSGAPLTTRVARVSTSVARRTTRALSGRTSIASSGRRSHPVSRAPMALTLPEPAERPAGDQPGGLASPRTTRPLQRREDRCLGRGKTEALPRPRACHDPPMTSPPAIVRVENATRGTVVADRVRVAHSMRDRTVGLLGRDGLAADEGRGSNARRPSTCSSCASRSTRCSSVRTDGSPRSSRISSRGASCGGRLERETVSSWRPGLPP